MLEFKAAGGLAVEISGYLRACPGGVSYDDLGDAFPERPSGEIAEALLELLCAGKIELSAQGIQLVRARRSVESASAPIQEDTAKAAPIEPENVSPAETPAGQEPVETCIDGPGSSGDEAETAPSETMLGEPMPAALDSEEVSTGPQPSDEPATAETQAADETPTASGQLRDGYLVRRTAADGSPQFPILPEPIRELPISVLDIPQSLKGFLTFRGYETLGQIADAGHDGLMKLNGFGLTKYQRVLDALEGLRFDPETYAVEDGGAAPALGPVPLEEWVASLEGSRRRVIELRLAGKTLQECGDELGITRQRTQQLEASALKHRPPIEEEKHQYLVDTYQLSAEQFSAITGETEEAYRYLDTVSTARRIDRKPLVEACHDEQLSPEIRQALAGFDDGKSVFVDGEAVSKSTSKIVEQIAPRLVGESPYEDIVACYEEFLEENGLKEDRKLAITSRRAFESLLARNEKLLWVPRPAGEGDDYGRYYDMSSYDYAPLVELLKSDEFDGLECSTAIIVNSPTARPVLEALDIRNEWELHTIIRRCCPQIEGIELGRMPTISLNSRGRNAQVLELIKELGPIDAAGLAEEYERRYGINRATFRASYLKDFSAYLKDGAYVCEDSSLDDEQVAYLKEALFMPFYTLGRVSTMLGRRYPGVDPASIASDAARFGYKVSGELLIREDLDAVKLFSNYLESYEEFRFGDEGFGREVTVNDEFRKALAIATRALAFVECEKGRFVSAKRLERNPVPITQDDMKSFADAAVDYAKDGEPFTVKSLLDAGFDHPLVAKAREAGLGDLFLGSLVSTACVGGRVKRTAINESAIFCKTAGMLSFADLLRYIMGQADSAFEATAEWMVETLDREYGIEISGAVIRTYMKNLGVVLDARAEDEDGAGDAVDNG